MTPTTKPLSIIQTGSFSVKMPSRLGFDSEGKLNPLFSNYNAALKDSSNEIQNQEENI